MRRILGELEALNLSVEILRSTKVDRTLDELKNVLEPDHVAYVVRLAKDMLSSSCALSIGVQRKRLKHTYRELKREYKRVHVCLSWIACLVVRLISLQGGWSSTRSDSTYVQVPAPPDSLDDFIAPVPVLKIKLGWCMSDGDVLSS